MCFVVGLVGELIGVFSVWFADAPLLVCFVFVVYCLLFCLLDWVFVRWCLFWWAGDAPGVRLLVWVVLICVWVGYYSIPLICFFNFIAL